MRLRQLALPLLIAATSAYAGQAPRSAASPDITISGKDRLYAADQFSNTVSVIDPAQNRLLGVIKLGDAQPSSLSPLYRGQLLVHGLGFSPDGRTLAVVSIGSNSVSFIDTTTNAVEATTYIGRSPHEVFFTPDGRELWGHRAWRGLHLGDRSADPCREDTDQGSRWPRHADLFA